MNLENEFVKYEQTLALRELGFEEPCLGYYIELKNPVEGLLEIGLDNEYLQAPLYQQAFRWFREKHFYISYVCAPYKEHDEFYFRIRHIGDVINEGQLESCESQVYKSYEEAELACLEKLIEVVEQSKSE